MASRECSFTCVVVSVVMMFGLISLVVCGSFFQEGLLSPLRQERANVWAQQSSWLSTQCRVLATGVANRGTCPGDNTAYSECPGYSFCAYEDEDCICNGNVLFAPILYGGSTMPDMAQSTELKGNAGTVKCGISSFDKDPAVGYSKACFCVKREISDLVQNGGPLDGPKCLKEGNEAYWKSSTGASSLAAVESMAAIPIDAASEVAEDDDESVTEVEDSSFEAYQSNSFLLEIPDGYDSRRRGGCSNVLLPWALVEVGGEEDPFGRGSAKRLRCAYEYGAEAVSREHTIQKTNTQFGAWARLGTVDCMTLGSCVVSMLRPSQLVDAETKNGGDYWSSAWLLMGAALVVLTLGGFAGGMCDIEGFTPLDFQVYGALAMACLFVKLVLLLGVAVFSSNATPHSILPSLEAGFLAGTGVIIVFGVPQVIFHKLHHDSGNRPAIHRQSSGPTRFILRRTNSVRDAVGGPRVPSRGSHVRLISAEEGLPSGEEGYVAGIEGEILIFQSESGDIVRVGVDKVRIVA